MAEILRLKEGCRISLDTILHEGYEISGNSITANVSIGKIEDVLIHFIAMHDEPLFFILELPAKADDEQEVKPGVVESLHRDVYYIDGCSREEAVAILEGIGSLLYNDGLSSFGFGGHKSSDEIMFGKYNVLQIYSRDISSFDGFLEEHKIERVDNLVTGWDVISKDNPGICSRYEEEGKSVFDIPEEFKDWGIYMAEQREE
ncbi:hypothetical protein [Butyrivibrio sp. AE3004]|uniref:hypothetical protein n=1 Tax=Butyrivibrio sp. AE3004 TaxID=1506994 RepID=UPI000AD23106|nr:hypothetical protein [Butyrivibrio sp. AE3004]